MFFGNKKKEDPNHIANVMQSTRENLVFSAWWEAYKVTLQGRAMRGDTPVGAAEFAHNAATAAAVDYREESLRRDKRVVEMWERK